MVNKTRFTLQWPSQEEIQRLIPLLSGSKVVQVAPLCSDSTPKTDQRTTSSNPTMLNSLLHLKTTSGLGLMRQTSCMWINLSAQAFPFTTRFNRCAGPKILSRRTFTTSFTTLWSSTLNSKVVKSISLVRATLATTYPTLRANCN